MIKDTQFLSVDQMRQVPPNHNTVVVSILDRSENSLRPNLQGFRDCLQLDFEDAYEEVCGLAPYAWGDEPDLATHQQYAGALNERLPTLDDARRIVAFLRKHQQSADPVTLLAHCRGGISRSAAVALFVASMLHATPLWTDMATTEAANPRLLRLLLKAWYT